MMGTKYNYRVPGSEAPVPNLPRTDPKNGPNNLPIYPYGCSHSSTTSSNSQEAQFAMFSGNEIYAQEKLQGEEENAHHWLAALAQTHTHVLAYVGVQSDFSSRGPNHTRQ